MLHIHYLERKVVVVVVACHTCQVTQVKLEASIRRINRRLKSVLCLELCFSLAASTMLAVVG